MSNGVCNGVSYSVTNDVQRRARNDVRTHVQTRPDQTVVSKACGLLVVQFIFKAKERNARVLIGLAR